MFSGKQQPTSYLLSREDFNDDYAYYQYLLERKHALEESVKRIDAMEAKFISTIGDLAQQEGNREQKLLKLLSLVKEYKLLTSPSSVKSNNSSNSPWLTQCENNNNSVHVEKLKDEGASTSEKSQQFLKDLKPNTTDINVQGCNKIFWASTNAATRELLNSEPQPSTSAAARAYNGLIYSNKRKMDDDDLEMQDDKNTENTGLMCTSPSGNARKILVVETPVSNGISHTITKNINDDRVYHDLQNSRDLSIRNNQYLNTDDKNIVISKHNNDIPVVARNLFDSDSEPSTSTGSISLKRKTSDDVMNYPTDVEDLSIRNNQTTPNINIDTANSLECIGLSLAYTISTLNQLLKAETQPSTATGAMSLKQEINKDFLDYLNLQTTENQLKDNHKITDNAITLNPIDRCSSNTLTMANCTTRQYMYSEPQPSTSTAAKFTKRTKRKKTNESLNGKDISIENEQKGEYPKKTDTSVILGPNGTEISLYAYDTAIWTSAASATRHLLGCVFSSDTLATHTLSGKPSPAFYGRERPAKMQLDPNKIADIIYCIRRVKNYPQREIRAAITTKCSDASKKYKRQFLKQLQATPLP